MKVIEGLLLIAFIMCGANFTANAQLGGLLNKAKSAVSKDKQNNNSNNNQNAQQNNSNSNSQSSSQSSQEEELRRKLDAARTTETNDDDSNSSTESTSQEKPSYPTSLSELDSKLFIYNPADAANRFSVPAACESLSRPARRSMAS